MPPELRPYQKRAETDIINNPFHALWLEPGFGKTLTTLNALTRIRPSGNVLLTGPKVVVKSVWSDEIEKWGFNIRLRSLMADEKGRKLDRTRRHRRYLETLDGTPRVYLLNYDLITDLVDWLPEVTGPDGKPMIYWPFPNVIIDEAQAFKGHDSQKFKALQHVRPQMQRMIQLTGTPMPHGIEDLWSQMYLLDQGQALGRNITTFRSNYMKEITLGNTGVRVWEPLPDAQTRIEAAIKHLVTSVSTDELKMPKPLEVEHKVHLEPKLMKAYKTFKKELVAKLQLPGQSLEEVVAANEGALRIKCLQFAAGTLYGEAGNKEYAVVHEEKLNAVCELLDELNSPLLLAYHFRSDADLLLKRLASRKYEVVQFDGSKKMIDDWNARRHQVMLLQPASAGHGINLQYGGHHMGWYTLPDSYAEYHQACCRLHRSGQAEQVVLHNFLTVDTVDMDQPERLELRRENQDHLTTAVRAHDVSSMLKEFTS